ncbi:MAG: hypothetical protein WA751_08600 [Candidatus Dormiibacterota bacterium]
MPRRKPGIPEEEKFEGIALEPVKLGRLPESARRHLNGAAVTTEALLGCRRGEMLGLRWEDVHLDDSRPWLVLRRSLQPVNGHHLQALKVKAEKSVRRVAITTRLVAALRAHQVTPWSGPEWCFASLRLPDRAMSPEYLHRKAWNPIKE